MENKRVENKELKNKNKMVKVRINLPTLNPNFKVDDMSTQIGTSQMDVITQTYAVGSEIEVPEDIANMWCNEVHYISDGRMGVRNHIDVGVQNNPYEILQDPDIKYGQKMAALNKYAADMTLATKIKITRASLI